MSAARRTRPCRARTPLLRTVPGSGRMWSSILDYVAIDLGPILGTCSVNAWFGGMMMQDLLRRYLGVLPMHGAIDARMEPK